jgi:hypothetical protein
MKNATIVQVALQSSTYYFTHEDVLRRKSQMHDLQGLDVGEGTRRDNPRRVNLESGDLVNRQQHRGVWSAYRYMGPIIMRLDVLERSRRFKCVITPIQILHPPTVIVIRTAQA